MSDEFDAEAWLASRPTLTEDRSHPHHWYNRAADLRASAGAIWYSMSAPNREAVSEELGFGSGHDMGIACWNVYHMLCGLALEVIIKAVLVQRGVKGYETHELKKLSELLGVTPAPDEARLLAFYVDAVFWIGRYPTPKNATEEKLMTSYERANSVLFSRSKVSPDLTLEWVKPSGATDWPQFSELWLKYANLFDHFKG
ncbi:MAG: HEPN domain-containing protein [Pseudomonas sp.]